MTSSGFEYLAFGPKGDGPQKLVILLHGYGRNAYYMEKMAEEVHLALPSATILCPHAPEPLDYSRFDDSPANFFRALPEDVSAGGGEGEKSMLRQWFAIEGDIKELSRRMQPAAARVNAFIDLQRDMLGVKDGDIALMGFSQGGGLALYAGMARARELGCVVCHSSIMFDGTHGEIKSRPAVYFIHGNNDQEFSPAAYARSFDWIQSVTGDKAENAIIDGMGHYTSAESRRLCAACIGSRLLS